MKELKNYINKTENSEELIKIRDDIICCRIELSVNDRLEFLSYLDEKIDFIRNGGYCKDCYKK